MNRTAAKAIENLETTAGAIVTLCRDVSVEEAREREAEGKWSILEIVNHLLDEEMLDFRARLRSTIEDPARTWPRIDPPAWVIERDYQNRDLVASVEGFTAERAASLEFLASITDDDLRKVHRHPSLGEMSGGDILHSWIAHDLLHLRQIIRARYQLLERRASPFGIEYAGEW